MSNGKHSFVRMTKLNNVRGRVNYITDLKRQENLYATFTNVPRKCWYYLAKENQRDFCNSGTTGKCIEARELIIMLPPSLIEYDHDKLLKYFTTVFAEKYDVACQSALHHNKTKTNLHIHLIFSERKALEEPERKIAKRNMFYDESGKHVRTKKEILDEDGNIRSGCKIIKKGDAYQTNFFETKNPYFKSNAFLKETKELFTEVCNDLVKNENEKLTVFQTGGPYLATRKIGKNNPKAEEIKTDNYLRQEWNRMVDRGLIEGMQEQDLVAIKKDYINNEVAKSVKEHGYQPGLFTQLLQKAVGKLRSFIDFFIFCENAEKDENGDVLIYEDVVLDMTPAALPPREKGAYPSSEKEQLDVMHLTGIDEKLKVCSRRVYAIEKDTEKLKQRLKELPKGFFHRKERKELEDKIAANNMRLEKERSKLDTIPMMNGFANVAAFKKVLKKAKANLEAKEKLQEEWRRPDPKPEAVYWRVPANAKKDPVQEHKPEERRGIKEQLAEKRMEIEKQSPKTKKKKSMDRDFL